MHSQQKKKALHFCKALYLLAPRPGLEPGTYGLTEIQAREKKYINQQLILENSRRVVIRVIERKL